MLSMNLPAGLEEDKGPAGEDNRPGEEGCRSRPCHMFVSVMFNRPEVVEYRVRTYCWGYCCCDMILVSCLPVSGGGCLRWWRCKLQELS